jgi:hypothetical protein
VEFDSRATGIQPNGHDFFRQHKLTDMPAQTDDMVRLTSDLLDRVPGDAILHFDYECMMLMRRAGELSLNARSDVWPPHRLAAVHQSYSRGTHVFG